MNLLQEGEYNLAGLSRINILLGKNGCGKSSLLKKVEQSLTAQNVGEINYVTPERGGYLRFDPNVEQNSTNDPNWTKNTKRNNQWGSFKEYSISQYRKLELLALREIESNQILRQDLGYNFDSVISKINSLLTNIKIVRTSKGDFEIFTKDTNNKIDVHQISSGESELISLAIECLTFEKSCDASRQNILLMDEPDVHLHPDLQVNLMTFLIELANLNKFSVIIATHSTAILGGLLNYNDATFAILSNKSTTASFRPINLMYQNILPIFGAHPLTNLFNLSPILLVEGEDDVRVFQQAIRSSNGLLKIYPCSVDGVGNLHDYENSVIEIINGVYDNAIAYSLRDRDEGDENIADNPPLLRFKTSCRAVENLIVCDETLTILGTTWELLETDIEKWLNTYTGHSKHNNMQAFKDSGYNRKEFDLKEIRNILVGLTGSSKPWEISVGLTISRLITGHNAKDFSNNKLCNFLGNKFSNVLRP